MIKIKAKMNQVFQPDNIASRIKWLVDDYGRYFPVVIDLSEEQTINVRMEEPK